MPKSVSWLESGFSLVIGMNMNHCSAPPLVENSRLLSSDKDWDVGTTTQYSCEEGFYITGQSEIECGDDNGEVDWSGELPECRKLGMTINFFNFHSFTKNFHQQQLWLHYCNFTIKFLNL